VFCRAFRKEIEIRRLRGGERKVKEHRFHFAIPLASTQKNIVHRRIPHSRRAIAFVNSEGYW
jgi:hypothetical protein